VVATTTAVQRRSYVSETRRDNAQVAEAQIETVVRLDKAELEKAQLALGAQKTADGTAVSPMAGRHIAFRCPAR